MAERARWLLLTHEGRVTLAVVYVLASIASIVTYAIARGPGYAAGQVALTSFGLGWAWWCLRRS